MPIVKCSNGKYRIGTGACIYDSEDKAMKVWKAILSSGNYAVDLNKVSYDYDETLTIPKIVKQALQDIKEGKQVYIITRRNRSQEVLDKAKELGISASRVIFTNGSFKYDAIKHYGISTHYDNNPREIELIKQNTKANGVLI